MKDLVYSDIYKKVYEELGIPREKAEKAYKSFWKFIKTKIEELPLKEDLTEEEFNELRTNFNIPSIGKLNCTYERFLSMKRRYKKLLKYRNKDGRV